MLPERAGEKATNPHTRFKGGLRIEREIRRLGLKININCVWRVLAFYRRQL